MSRAANIATAAVLALAVAAMPILLDQCAESCEARHGTVASTPACHHAGSTGTRVGHVPLPCGHDHGAVSVPAVKSAPLSAVVDSIVPIQIVRASVTSAAADDHLSIHAPPGSSSALNTQSRRLRI